VGVSVRTNARDIVQRNALAIHISAVSLIPHAIWWRLAGRLGTQVPGCFEGKLSILGSAVQAGPIPKHVFPRHGNIVTLRFVRKPDDEFA